MAFFVAWALAAMTDGEPVFVEVLRGDGARLRSEFADRFYCSMRSD